MLSPIQMLTAFPMQVGEMRGFCTRLKMDEGALIVSAPRIEEWLTSLAGHIFGGGLQTREKSLGYPNPLKTGHTLEALLLLLWVRKVPLQEAHFASIKVEGVSEGVTVVEGEFVLVIPP